MVCTRGYESIVSCADLYSPTAEELSGENSTHCPAFEGLDRNSTHCPAFEGLDRNSTHCPAFEGLDRNSTHCPAFKGLDRNSTHCPAFEGLDRNSTHCPAFEGLDRNDVVQNVDTYFGSLLLCYSGGSALLLEMTSLVTIIKQSLASTMYYTTAHGTMR